MAALWVWPAGAVAYLILVGSFSADEVGMAVVLGGLGAAWHVAVLRCGACRFAFERPALGEIGRALAGLPGATLRVGATLATAMLWGAAGRQVDVRFAIGRRDEPVDAGRRAVVVLATSLAPDSYVLRIPADAGAIQVHALTGRVPAGGRRWPA